MLKIHNSFDYCFKILTIFRLLTAIPTVKLQTPNLQATSLTSHTLHFNNVLPITCLYVPHRIPIAKTKKKPYKIKFIKEHPIFARNATPKLNISQIKIIKIIKC